MATDRWRQVEDLCHAALARHADERRAFLAEVCKDDEELQHEVESLLALQSSAEGFMSVPAAALAGSAALHPVRGRLVGARFGSYTMRSLLGVGGMGEVYRAHDAILDREVAIKVLSPAFTADPERQSRFEREARLLATLNHPHIGAIYGVEQAEGVRGLVLELVEGETLAERIAARRPSISEALAIARQITEALEAAHDKGIVHRDLKPANIKMTPGGVVKILDFGLAKIPATAEPADVHQSKAGTIFGTAAYMSPEQARGLDVDRRTDIWAFGCVLFEMLAGRVAFAGETVSDTIATILERDPDWSLLPEETPAGIRRLLLRCLAKDPKRRLRDIADVRIDIDAAGDEPSAETETPRRSPRADQRRTWLPWAAIVGVAVAVGMREAWRPPIIERPPLSDARFSYLTDWEGAEMGAEISPDGKFIAFKADRNGEVDLFVSQVGTGRFYNLTENMPSLGTPGIIRAFGFTGDGAYIWFAEGGDAAAPKWLVPLTGGTPRAFLRPGDAAASWSRDDTRLAFFTNGNGDPISIADRTSADARPLVVDAPEFFANSVHNHNPVWSPDGQWLYFSHGPEPTEEMNVWRVRPSGGVPEQLTVLRAAANHIAVIDLRTLLYAARGDDGSGPWLWSLDVETKKTRRVTSGLEHYSSVAASSDGRRVVATVSRPTVRLWRVPLRDRPSEDRDVQPYELPSGRALSPRFGGTSLFYLSGRGAGDSLWRSENGQASEVWKVANDSLSEPPAVSPDGTQVAIAARQEGTLRLSLMAADGTTARTLAPSITIQSSAGRGSAAWSPDGKSIVAAGRTADGAGLFKIPVDGGAPVRLVAGQVTNPVWSPDGSLIVYASAAVGGRVLLLATTPDGTKVVMPELWAGLGGGHRFLPNGTGLVYLPRSPAGDFWLFDFATKTTRELTRLGSHGRIQTFDISPDGKEIVFDRVRDNSNIVIIDLNKDAK